MAKEPWHKGRVEKVFKKSPAAQKVRGAYNSAMEHLGLTEESDNRNAHFEHGSTEHQDMKMHTVLNTDADADQNFENRGLGVGSIGNVTSIREGYRARAERAMRRQGY